VLQKKYIKSESRKKLEEELQNLKEASKSMVHELSFNGDNDHEFNIEEDSDQNIE